MTGSSRPAAFKTCHDTAEELSSTSSRLPDLVCQEVARFVLVSSPSSFVLLLSFWRSSGESKERENGSFLREERIRFRFGSPTVAR